MPMAQPLARHEKCALRLPDGWVRTDKPADGAGLHSMRSGSGRQNKES
ncbi:hypothetical protein [Nocardia brasiliensis]